MELLLKNRQELKVRALLLGDRLDLKLFKIADCLATTPLTLQVDEHGGIAVLFRYGVLVLFGVQTMDEVRFIESIRPLLTNPYAVPEVEELEIHSGRSGIGVQSGAVSLDEITLEKLQLIADALSKNLVLTLYEKKVAGEFDKIEPLAQELATRGRVSADTRKLLQKIGSMLLIEHRMVGRAEIGDKPETLWDYPQLEGLYASLEDEFELKERQAALDRKLGLIADTAQTLADVWDNKQLHKLEWYVIGLILFEIVISLIERGEKFLH
ncbi:RMD1 family protein [Ferrigenium sp. UT5]|uniref:RMD1 family protein n=1 Tax=Ferrigenium sp. UT5 TaxID=3242105 RepID=UPI003550D93C